MLDVRELPRVGRHCCGVPMHADQPLHLSRRWAALVLTMLAVAASGCAKPPPASDPEAVADFKANNDPYEPTNRFFYGVSLTIDKYTLKPVAQAYVFVFPRPVRSAVHNLLGNIGEPVTFFNSILEAKPRRAGSSLVRFAVNSTAGIGGLFDVASQIGYKEPDSNGGLTLASWGIPSGPYLFLPVLGPSNVRNGIGRGVDVALSPYTYVPRGYGLLTFNYAEYGLSAIDARSMVLHDLDELQKTSLDPYATIRSAYQQRDVSDLQHLREETGFTPPDWYAR